MKKCPKCETENEDKRKFCKFCGIPIQDIVPEGKDG